MPKPSKSHPAHRRRSAKPSSHESAAGSDTGGESISGAAEDIAKEGAFKLLDFANDKAKESIQDLENHDTPEFEGLGDAAGAKEEASENAELDANSFQRKLQRLKASGGAGPSEEQLKDLAEKQEAAKEAAGGAAFADRALGADESNLKATQEKIQQLEDEHAQLVKDTSGWTKFLQFKPQFVLEKTKKQTEQELEDQKRILNQLERQVGQDEDKKFNTADAANAAKEDLAAARESLLKKLQSPDEGSGRDSSFQQVAGALKQASEADKAVLEALRTFDATAQSIKAYAAAVKQRLDGVNQTLEAHTRAISELYSRLRTNPGGVQQ